MALVAHAYYYRLDGDEKLVGTERLQRMQEKRALGRPKQPGKKKTQIFTLVLEVDTAYWGKQQPGGLSSLVRRLLREEFARSQNKT